MDTTVTISSEYGSVQTTHDDMDTDATRSILEPVVRAAAAAAADEDYPVPEDEEFDGDWFDGADAAAVALTLTEKHKGLFRVARNFTIDYRWKRKGGGKGHEMKLGMCVRVSGLTKAYAPHLDFVIWLAADNVRDARFTRYQVEALIFHELLHIGRTNKGKPAIIPHDLEAFTREVREYGLWKSDVQRMGEAFQQLRLAVE